MDFKLNNSLDKCVQLSVGKSVLFFMLIITIFSTPAVTHAGFWSWFTGQDALAQTETYIATDSDSIYEPVTPPTNSDLSVKPSLVLAVDGDALLPEVGPSTAAPDTVDNSNGQISTYIVRSGDTLAKIAEMFDVSVNTILWANDMTRASTLKVGQTLVILPISGVMHKVVSGDTLASIAKKYGGDVDEIAGFNDLVKADKLVIGDTIMIPDGQVSSSIRPSSAANSTSRLISSAGGPAYVGYYIKPFINGRRTQGLHGYNGVDYGMPSGSPLYASAAGTVIISKNSGWNGGYGNYVVIQHLNGTQTVYGHMSGAIVSVGEKVMQGQTIGYSGNSGKSTGPHLHFEIRGAKNPF